MHIATRTIDSPLGRWTHAEARPTHLAGVVQSIWYFDGVVAERRERVFPNGVAEIIVHLGDRYRLVEGSKVVLCAPASLNGVQLAPLVIEAPRARSRVLGIRLYPAGAFLLLGTTLGALTGLTVDLEAVVGQGAAELVERCQAAPTAEACIAAADSWVAARLDPAREPDRAVVWIAGEIERHAGAVSIGRLRERAGLSKTRLVEGFREQIGVPPKLYARIHRFHRTLALLHHGTAPRPHDAERRSGGEQVARSLSRLALDAGYYDQSHMNAEFRAMSGLSPLEYLRSTRYPGSASRAEPA